MMQLHDRTWRRPSQSFRRLLIACFAFAGIQSLASQTAGALTLDELRRAIDASVQDWRYHIGPVTNGESQSLDDSQWGTAQVGFLWKPHDSVCWFRRTITVPDRISGTNFQGGRLYLRAGIDNEGVAYVNGRLQQRFERDTGMILLAEHARPGDTFHVAILGINHPGTGSLLRAELVADANRPNVEPLQRLVAVLERVQSFLEYGPQEDRTHWQSRLDQALAAIDMNAYREGNSTAFLPTVTAALDAVTADRVTLDADLGRITALLTTLESLLPDDQSLAYQRLNARVVRSFLEYVRDDLQSDDPGHQVRGLWTVPYLERLADETLQQTRAIAAGQETELTVPRYRSGRAEISQGVFRQHGRPVFFTGVGHFDQVRRDIPILNEYGLNIIQIEVGTSSVVKGPDHADDRVVREDILPVLDRAARHNVAVNLLVSPHYFPQWAIEQEPTLSECGHGFIKHCIDAPLSREIHQRHISTLMPLIAGHPALHSICLSNEPQYDGRCQHTRKQFTQWLRGRYGNLERLAQTHGTAYSDFESVPFPEATSPYPLRFDYFVFNQQRFLEFHRFLADEIHRYDPALPVHAKVMSHAMTDPGRFEVGTDFESFSRIGRIAGNDCIQNFRDPDAGQYLQRWQDAAMNFTFQRAVTDGSPVFNSEAHVIVDGDRRFVPGSHIRTAYWTQALHGQGAATTWVWERAQGGDFAENILTRAHCVRELGRIGLDLCRLAAEVHALQQAEPHLAIFYSWSSFYASAEHIDQVRAAFEGAYFADAVPTFVTERQALHGGLKRFQLIIIPQAVHVPDDVFEAFQQYLASGGVLMTTGPVFVRDEYGRPRDKTLKAGPRGRIVAYPGSLRPRAYREILDDLLAETAPQRLTRIRGPHGEPIWGVHAHTAQDGQNVLVSLVNYTHQPIELIVEPLFKPDSVRELFSGRAQSPALTVRPLEPALLQFRTRDESTVKHSSSSD